MWYVAASCTGLFILPFYYLDFGPYLWRIAVGFGAVPAFVILLLRSRYMDESPVWAAQNLGLEEAARVIRKIYGVAVSVVSAPREAPVAAPRFSILFSKPFIRATLLASIVCATQSMEYFAVGFNLPTISMSLFGSDYIVPILGAVLFNLFGIAGGMVGVLLTGRLGCRTLAILGYCVVIASLALMWLGGSELSRWLQALLFGMFIFGHAAGPGSQGMTIATVSYPTAIRGLGSGWGQGMVRVGSIFGFYFFPLVLAAVGLRGTMTWIALVPIVGLVGCLLIPWKASDQILSEDLAEPTGLTRATPV